MLHKVLTVHHTYSMNLDCVSYEWQCCKSINKLHHYFSLQNNNPSWSCSTSEWVVCWFPIYLHEFSNVCYSNEIPYISIIVKICNDWAMGKQQK